MKTLYKLLIILCLVGCAKDTPTETIIDDNIGHFENVLDYAHNNMEQNADIVLLENELDSCIIVLNSVKQTYYSEMDACEAKTNYWRLMSTGLGILVAGIIFFAIKRKIKVF